ncbi:MAG TPA: homoserine dehydrogenase [Acidimicrobiales bacterium]|nr:homoserine dehydrogenase [Acidimicrobiales bacterium]
MTPSGRPARLGVLGCGNVGAALVELVDGDAPGIEARSGVRLEVARVAVRNIAKPRTASLGPDRLTHDAHEVVNDPSIDIVVECVGGIEPARTLVVEALKAGKPVVSANKELLANFGSELRAVAESAGRELLYEAAVGGAIPLLRALRVSLAGERVRRVMGIVNGTTNYVLTRMTEDRIGYQEALKEAQGLGYAERDPSADVEGHDASAKAAILASIAFNADVVAGDVYREGIETIDVGDVEFAARLGYVVKLLAVVERVEDGAAEGGGEAISLRVHPAMVPREHPLAGVRGPFNAVFVEGEAAGELMLYGRGAGGHPTASAVLGDVIDVAAGLGLPSRRHGGPARHVAVRPIDELRAQYYLAIDVIDRPGVLARVARVFGDHDVSIRSMEQVGLGAEARLVFITHMALEADIQATLSELARDEAVERTGGLLRVIGPER